MKECPECEALLSNSVKICPVCGCNLGKYETGEDYDEKEAEPEHTCPECGAIVNANVKRCPVCDAKIKRDKKD